MNIDDIKGKYQHPLQDLPGSDDARRREALEKMSREVIERLQALENRVKALEGAGG